MTRTMYDATAATAFRIPANAQMVAGYDTDHSASQSIKWTDADWARYPNAVHVHICGDGSDVGDVLDIESGAATLDQIVGWLLARKQHTGIWKSLYYSFSLDSDVQAVLAQAGIDSKLIPKWIAWYNGNASLDDVPVVGIVAKQYTNGDSYDTSVVADHWPGIDSTQEDYAMGPYNTGNGVYWITLDGQLLGLKDQTAGQYVSVSPDDLNTMAAAQAAAFAKLVSKLTGAVTGTITGTIT